MTPAVWKTCSKQLPVAKRIPSGKPHSTHSECGTIPLGLNLTRVFVQPSICLLLMIVGCLSQVLTMSEGRRMIVSPSPLVVMLTSLESGVNCRRLFAVGVLLSTLQFRLTRSVKYLLEERESGCVTVSVGTCCRLELALEEPGQKIPRQWASAFLPCQ